MSNLSKSKYTTYCQCPKALWLKVFKPEEQVVDASTEARFKSGNEVGDLAMGLFGDFTEVTTYQEQPNGSKKLDLKVMIAKTDECLKKGIANIAEASFSYDGCYCAVDILHKTAEGYAIYEVKSSSTLDHLDVYAQDVAYQKYVLTQCGLNIIGTYLVNINSKYVLNGDLDILQYFKINDISEAVADELPKVKSRIKAAKALLKQEEPEQDIMENCHKCSFWKYCTKDILPHPSVFDLYRMNFNKALEHKHNGRLTLEDMRNEKLTPIQHMQVECTLQNKIYINKEGIRKFLKTLSYPLYFLDFETEQTIIPKYQGTHPNQQIPFQYSLHYIEEEGGELKHKEFLGISGEDPRRAIAEQLCKDIPLDVCTTVYNQTFECTRLKELADAFPDLAPHLRNIKDNIKDFLAPFQDAYYYVPAMNGSFSIKKVLPALFPDAPELDYHNLEGGVQNGGDAMNIFPQIQFMTPEGQEKARRALLDYCCLDTLAMVKLWEKLRDVSK